MTVRFCAHCGHVVGEQDNFCAGCGTAIVRAIPQPVIEQPVIEQPVVEPAATVAASVNVGEVVPQYAMREAVETAATAVPGETGVTAVPGICPYCGQAVHPQAVLCVHCGRSFQDVQMTGGKKRLTAGLLGIFLGALGVHNFYLGCTGKAIAQLLMTVLAWWLVLPPLAAAIWGFVEGILILCGRIDKDGRGWLLG